MTNPNQNPPDSIDVDTYLLRSTAELLKNGAGALLAADNRIYQMVVEDMSDPDDPNDLRSDIRQEEFFNAERPLAVYRQELGPVDEKKSKLGGSMLVICKVDANGVFDNYEHVQIASYDEKGVMDFNWAEDLMSDDEAAKTLVDAALKLEQEQKELGWSPIHIIDKDDLK